MVSDQHSATYWDVFADINMIGLIFEFPLVEADA